MKRLVVATKNKGKIKEIEEILGDLPVEVVSMADAGISIDIDENGSTFEENALIKAKEVCRLSGETVLSDDSGLEVDSLNGAPGIYSARFSGEGATDHKNNQKLLEMLKDVPFEKRTARFVCAIAVVFPSGESFTVRGTCEGMIGFEPAGEQGFGYDPLFYMPEYDKTMAQLPMEEKNKVSHRGKALRLMVGRLASFVV